MRRRQFIIGLGGAMALPLVVRAQQPVLPKIGYLYSGSPELSEQRTAAFRDGLNEAGYVQGRNVDIEFRFAHGVNERLPDLAGELVRQQVNVIATPASTPAALAAKAATKTIPIVFGVGSDPIKDGLVASLNRPGGNVTGVSFLTGEIAGKRLGLSQEFLPSASRFALLVNPNNPVSDLSVKEIQSAASAQGRQVEVLTASTSRDIEDVFARVSQKRIDVLIISPDALFSARRIQLVTLSSRYAVPTMFSNREFTEVGGLMSYGPSVLNAIRQVGSYTGRILKGDKPADLPVLQPTKFELILNLVTAKALGLTIPPTLLARADEVIE